MPQTTPLRILDLGTGTGALAAGYANLGNQVSGVDFSEAMLEQARTRVPNATFVQGDIAFTNRAALEQAQAAWRQQWDEAEFYWVADETLAARGFEASFEPVSFCAGIFRIVPA